MKYLHRYGFLIFTIILTIIGFIKIIYSVENGTDSAALYLSSSKDGVMDTGDFRIIWVGYILTNITLGLITFFIGLTFLCISLYKLSK